jgi:dTDP-4-amino-4,6-dideoxy-D-galactose acyltransferase
LTRAIERLDWDSAFFGMGVGRLHAETLTPEVAFESLQWCRENRVACLYFLGPEAGEVPSGFHLVDERVTLAWVAHPVTDQTPNVRSFTESDLPVLEDIARQSHRDSRFYADPLFDRKRCDELYATWIRRSCQGWADAVLVAVCDGIPAGYVTCTNDAIGLIAVAQSAQGRGLGRQLVTAAQDYFQSRGAARVTVVTQGRNRAARALYERCGFRLAAAQHWYHFHAA